MVRCVLCFSHVYCGLLCCHQVDCEPNVQGLEELELLEHLCWENAPMSEQVLDSLLNRALANNQSLEYLRNANRARLSRVLGISDDPHRDRVKTFLRSIAAAMENHSTARKGAVAVWLLFTQATRNDMVEAEVKNLPSHAIDTCLSTLERLAVLEPRAMGPLQMDVASMVSSPSGSSNSNGQLPDVSLDAAEMAWAAATSSVGATSATTAIPSVHSLHGFAAAFEAVKHAFPPSLTDPVNLMEVYKQAQLLQTQTETQTVTTQTETVTAEESKNGEGQAQTEDDICNEVDIESKEAPDAAMEGKENRGEEGTAEAKNEEGDDTMEG